MKKSLSFTKAFNFAINEFFSNFLSILKISFGWLILVAVTHYTISLTFPAEFSAFPAEFSLGNQLPGAFNTSILSYYILYFIITTLLFGMPEYLYTRLAFMSYHKGALLIPLQLSTGAKFILIQFLRRIAISLGSLLFIIPGIYLSIMYYFPGYSLIDETKVSMIDDLKYNNKLTNNVESNLLNLSVMIFFTLGIPLIIFNAFFLHLPFMEIRLYLSFLHALALPFLCFIYVHIYEQLKEQLPN